MKIKWYELLIVALTLLCAIVFFLHYFAFVAPSGIWISSEKGSTGQITVVAEEISSEQQEQAMEETMSEEP